MKKNKFLIVLISIIAILLICFFGSIIKTKYSKLSSTDQQILAEYNLFYKQIKTKDLWTDFDLANKPILAVSKDSLNTYLINAQDFNGNLFSKKLDLPSDYNLKSVYRISPMVLPVLKIRLDIGSNFNTIGKKYPIFGNDVYFVKYDEEESFKQKNTSLHFAPFIAHESFHYYMQNNWKLPSLPEEKLTDMDLIKKEYKILDEINAELHSNKDKNTLLNYANDYVYIVKKRIKNDKDYVTSELAQETAEGSAQYLTIKASKLVGYDYGIMYFDNVQNVPFSDVFKQIDAGNFDSSYLYRKMTYQTGALMCQLMDELDIPNWQGKLNKQTLDNTIYLYDVLKEYLNK